MQLYTLHDREGPKRVRSVRILHRPSYHAKSRAVKSEFPRSHFVHCSHLHAASWAVGE